MYIHRVESNQSTPSQSMILGKQFYYKLMVIPVKHKTVQYNTIQYNRTIIHIISPSDWRLTQKNRTRSQSVSVSYLRSFIAFWPIATVVVIGIACSDDLPYLPMDAFYLISVLCRSIPV